MCSPELGNGIITYSETTLARIIDLTTTVVAATLPVLSILLLYLIQSDTLRLGLIVALSAIFSLVLAVMTSSRKDRGFCRDLRVSASCRCEVSCQV